SHGLGAARRGAGLTGTWTEGDRRVDRTGVRPRRIVARAAAGSGCRESRGFRRGGSDWLLAARNDGWRADGGGGRPERPRHALLGGGRAVLAGRLRPAAEARRVRRHDRA